MIKREEGLAMKDGSLKTIKTAMGLLELFTVEKTTWGLSEMQKKTGLPKANIYRILRTLELLGYLLQDKETGKYYLSAKFYLLGSRSNFVRGLLSNGGEFLYQLHEAVGSTTTLNFLDGIHIVHIEVLPGKDGIIPYSGKYGRRVAYLAASGLAILAASPENVVSRFKNCKFECPTANSLRNYDEMLEELERIRKRKYSINNELRIEGVFALAMPIIGRDNRVEGSFSASCLIGRVDNQYVVNTVQAIREAAKGLSYQLGFNSENSMNNYWFN